MQIEVNGKQRVVSDGLTASELVKLLELTGRRVAVELNGEILPRSQHVVHTLNDGDRVEIVHAVGGG